MQTLIDPVTDFACAVCSMNGRTVKFSGRSWRIAADQEYGLEVRALNLTPQNPTEAKYCWWDLCRSESEKTDKFMCALAVAGGYLLKE